MIFARNNDNRFISYLIYQSMFIIYSPRPISLQLMFKRLRLTDAVKGLAQSIHYQANNSSVNFFVSGCPFYKILESIFFKNNFLQRNSFKSTETRFWFFATFSIACSKRFLLAGDLRR